MPQCSYILLHHRSQQLFGIKKIHLNKKRAGGVKRFRKHLMEQKCVNRAWPHGNGGTGPMHIPLCHLSSSFLFCCSNVLFLSL